MTLRLVRLDCPACGAAMKGRPFDIAFTCPGCGSGAVVDGDNLAPIPVVGVRPPEGKQVSEWRPGWLIEAVVEVTARVTTGGGSAAAPPLAGAAEARIPAEAIRQIAERLGAPRGIVEGVLRAAPAPQGPASVRVFPEGGAGAERARSPVRTFVVPAFYAKLATVVSMIRGYSRAPVAVTDAPRQALTGATVSLSAALDLVLHYLIGEEVGRPDVLASVGIGLHPVSHRLIALPFQSAAAGARCLVTGEEVRP